MHRSLARKSNRQITARDYIDAQGVDPALREEKAHCPDCGCALIANNTFGALGVSLDSMKPAQKPENIRDLWEPFIGFSHPKGKGKGCPRYYGHDPHFAYPPSRGTEQRERKRNRERLTEPDMEKANDVIFKRLMGRMLRRSLTSEEKRQIHRIAVAKVHRIRSLFRYPWREPYLRALAAGIRTCIDQNGEEYKAAWRPAEFVRVKYETVNPEDGLRSIWMPTELRLSFAYPQNDGSVIYHQMRDKETKVPIAVEVSRVAAYDIVATVYVRRTKKRKSRFAEAKRRLLQYRARRRGRKPPSRPVPEGQSSFLRKGKEVA
jgi:hypothetical protein